MMMWHTMVSVDVCTRIMAMCHVVIGSESTFLLICNGH